MKAIRRLGTHLAPALMLGLVGCASSPPPAPASAAPPAAAAAPAGAWKTVAKPPAPPAEFWAGRQDLVQAPAPPKPEELALPKLERFTLKNGLQVLVVARKDLPLVSFGLAIRAGNYDETQDTLGVSDFVAAMLRRGTKSRSADQISEAIDFVGGSLDARATPESTTVACSALSKDGKLCLDLLADMLLRPSFPESEMQDVRDQMLAALASRFDNPHELSTAHFDNQLFGENHPDGWVLTPEDVRKITRARLETFWKTYYRPNRAILAVAGDVDAGKVRADVEKAFGSWARAQVPERPAWKIPAPKTRILLVDRPDLTQATIVVGHPGIAHADPRWYAATLVNYALGGSDFSSRLMTEVRAKRGLTYGIGSTFGASLYPGAFRVLASTKNETVSEALLATVNEIRKMKADGPTVGELDKAKGYYAGSTPFALQTAASIASGLVGAELHGLGDAYVRELAVRLAGVGKDAADAAARELLNPDALTIVIVGSGDAIAPQLAKAGMAYERINFKAPIDAAARAAAGAKK